MSATAALRSAPGLTAYLEAVEERLRVAVASHPGTVAAVGADALAAGGKRLRPVLTFLSAPEGAAPPVTEGVAIELVHMATLVHDDIVDGARMRRGRAAAWTEHGSEPAKATGDYLFARAFSELAAREQGPATVDRGKVAVLADAALALARGEAMQRLQRHNPDTSVEAYLERVALKTARLFEAACVLGGGSAAFGHHLGIAFQIADDILDCAGDTIETGKIPGTDLRDGTPTLPLILAARKDAVVRSALAGGSLEGALVRVVSTGALDRSRELALDYVNKAKASLDGAARRDELSALADLVVDRNG
jgi:geranylgeranyl pyrophosphate synthase